MKKGICVFLSVMLFVTMLLSGTVLVSAASTEYIKTDKTEYKSGEMVKISYSLDVAESGRFICVYRNGEAIYNNLMYAMSAASLSNEGTLVPSSSVVWTWHGGGPSIMTSRLSAGSYIIKVMYAVANYRFQRRQAFHFQRLLCGFGRRGRSNYPRTLLADLPRSGKGLRRNSRVYRLQKRKQI